MGNNLMKFPTKIMTRYQIMWNVKRANLSNHVCTHLGASLCHSLIVAFPVPSMASQAGTSSILATNSDHQSAHLQPGRDEFMPPLRHRKDATRIGVSWSAHSTNYQLPASWRSRAKHQWTVKNLGFSPSQKNHLGYGTWAFASKNVTTSLFCVGENPFKVRQKVTRSTKKNAVLPVGTFIPKFQNNTASCAVEKNRRIWMSQLCALNKVFKNIRPLRATLPLKRFLPKGK